MRPRPCLTACLSDRMSTWKSRPMLLRAEMLAWYGYCDMCMKSDCQHEHAKVDNGKARAGHKRNLLVLQALNRKYEMKSKLFGQAKTS